MTEYESATHLFIWSPAKRAATYGALLFFILAGCILWPMGMSPLSNVALFWTVGLFWAFGLSLIAFWSARRDAKRRRSHPLVKLANRRYWQIDGPGGPKGAA